MATPIRVLIVDDSAVVRGSLGRIVDAAGDMRVVTTAVNGQAALDALRHTPADVVLLDIEMPVMDGLTALPLMLERQPGLRVLMTSSLTHEGAKVTMRALALGAVDFVHKPQAKDGVQALTALAAQLTGKIRAVAGGRGATSGTTASPAAGTATATAAARSNVSGYAGPPGGAGPGGARGEWAPPQVVAIASSTGGPNALAEIMRDLPGDFPVPILVTQHMPPIFTAMLAQRLSREGALACDEARDGEPLLAGHVYVAPGDYHMLVSGTAAAPTIRLVQGEPENHCRPAADPMFRSVAQVYGAATLAVVLTGMGDDGRRGCDVMVGAGGRVLVQDEASSVVWGMPGSVVEANVPCSIVPLSAMAGQLVSACCVRT